ncbi:hypothetical protein NL676_002342 [Syzygium grande]|nr:hypothetical protein NL676_002342 [Syzygium grande]
MLTRNVWLNEICEIPFSADRRVIGGLRYAHEFNEIILLIASLTWHLETSIPPTPKSNIFTSSASGFVRSSGRLAAEQARATLSFSGPLRGASIRVLNPLLGSAEDDSYPSMGIFSPLEQRGF